MSDGGTIIGKKIPYFSIDVVTTICNLLALATTYRIMNTDTPSPNAEEGAVSAPFEKLPKLNLPPKPVLATAATTTEAAPTAPAPAVIPVAPPVPAVPPPTPVTKPAAEPPLMATSSEKIAPPPAPVMPPAKKIEVTETSAPNKKRATLSLPLAMIAFVVALLGLVVQILSFLHLF